MLVAANRVLRREGVAGPDLLGLLDLVALATVADVAPLVGLNRALVRQGLAVMARGQRPGIAALAAAAGLTGAPTAYGLGFVLGPRVNAGGRVGVADLGARLLATEAAGEAAALAGRLEVLNAERRAIEAAVRAQAEAQAAGRGDGPLVWAAGEGWHPGVVGIVAARLKETFGRPALVVGFRGGEGRGSGRSVGGVDLGAAVARLAREGLIDSGGGHRMAAGVSLSPAQLEPAMARLGELLAQQGAGARPARSLRVDGLDRGGRRYAGAGGGRSRRPGLMGRGHRRRGWRSRGRGSRASGGSATGTWRWRWPTGSGGGWRRWRSGRSRGRSGPSWRAGPGRRRTWRGGSSATTGGGGRG